MKKHKKHKRKSHRKGTMNGIDGVGFVSTLFGAIGGKLIDKIPMVQNSPKIAAAAKVGVGLLLPMAFKTGKGKQIAAGVGNGLAIVGVMDGLKAFGVMNGVDDTITVEIPDAINGDDLPVVNGNDLPVVNGSEADEYMHVMAGEENEE